MFCKWCGRKFDDFSIKCPYCSGQQDALMNGNGFWDLCVFESNPMLIKIDGNDAVGKPLVSDDKNLKQVEQTCEVKDALPAAEKTEAAAPPVKPNKTNKPLVIILSSIICILVVGFIVLLVTMLNKSNDSKSNTEESAVSSSSSVPANEDKTDESDSSAGHKDSDTLKTKRKSPKTRSKPRPIQPTRTQIRTASTIHLTKAAALTAIIMITAPKKRTGSKSAATPMKAIRPRTGSVPFSGINSDPFEVSLRHLIDFGRLRAELFQRSFSARK